LTEDGEEPSPSERIRTIRGRSPHRDRDYLKLPRKNAMRALAEDFNEWIVQETRDLLEIITVLRSIGIVGVNIELLAHEKKVKEIQKKSC